jgi:hypothetical protein
MTDTVTARPLAAAVSLVVLDCVAPFAMTKEGRVRDDEGERACNDREE